MPDLSDRAIIDVEYYKLFDGIASSDTNFNDDELSQFINQASLLMENEANRSFISATATEIFPGNGTVEYIVKQKRITTLTSVHYWDGTQWVEATAPTYRFDTVESTGTIYFTDGNKFWSGNRNWKAVYIYGWVITDMPEELKEACCEVVKWLYSTRKKAGIQSETLGSKTVTYNSKKTTMPESAMAVIQRYKSIRYA